MRRLFLKRRGASTGGAVRVLPLVLSVGFILSGPRAVRAQTWTGGVSNAWNNPGNWTPNTVPNSGTANVSITSATNATDQVDISPMIANLTLGGAQHAGPGRGPTCPSREYINPGGTISAGAGTFSFADGLSTVGLADLVSFDLTLQETPSNSMTFGLGGRHRAFQATIGPGPSLSSLSLDAGPAPASVEDDPWPRDFDVSSADVT